MTLNKDYITRMIKEIMLHAVRMDSKIETWIRINNFSKKYKERVPFIVIY